jgi:hypothetical protein
VISKMALKVSKIEMDSFDHENYNFSTIEAKPRELELNGACPA